MQKGLITIDRLAAYLGWSTRFVEGLIRDTSLPCFLAENQRFFCLNDVLDWVEQNMHKLDESHVRQLETKMESSLMADGIFRTTRKDRLASRLPITGIALDVRVDSKPDLLQSMGNLAESTGLLYDRDELIASIAYRESLCSTAMLGGLALCHPRCPIPSIIERQFLCFLRTSNPVDFGAPDGSGTSLFFLLCTPDDRSHLHGLARLARILHGDILSLLKSAATPEDILTILTDAESNTPAKA